jgi:TIR domain
MSREAELRFIRNRCYAVLFLIIGCMVVGGYTLNAYERSHDLTYTQHEAFNKIEAAASIIFILSMLSLGGVERFAEWWVDRERRKAEPQFRFFISYTSREDDIKEFQSFIDEFIEAVQNRYLRRTFFYDRISLEQRDRTDNQLSYELEEALNQSGFMIAFISPKYLLSNWCMFEWETAHKLRPGRILVIEWKDTPQKSLLKGLPTKAVVHLGNGRDANRRTQINNLAVTTFNFLRRLCGQCRGRGVVRQRTQVCPRCGGTGLGQTDLSELLDDYVN